MIFHTYKLSKNDIVRCEAPLCICLSFTNNLTHSWHNFYLFSSIIRNNSNITLFDYFFFTFPKTVYVLCYYIQFKVIYHLYGTLHLLLITFKKSQFISLHFCFSLKFFLSLLYVQEVTIWAKNSRTYSIYQFYK